MLQKEGAEQSLARERPAFDCYQTTMMQYEHKIFVNQQSAQAQAREAIKDDSQTKSCRKQARPGKSRRKPENGIIS